MNRMTHFLQTHIDQALLHTHTAYLARVERTTGGASDVQPLTMQQHGGAAPQKQPLVAQLPKLKGVRVAPGDICLCVVCERDIADAQKGRMTLPSARRHDLSDSVIVGVLDNERL